MAIGRRGEAAEHQRALAADHDQADARRNGEGRAPVRISGAARCSVFCQEKDVPKPPRQTSAKNSTGDLPSSEQEDREQHRRRPAARRAGSTTASAERAAAPDRAGVGGRWRLTAPSDGLSVVRHGQRRSCAPPVRGRAGAVPAAGAERSAGRAPRARIDSGDRADDAFEQAVHAVEPRRRSCRASCRRDRPRCPCCP